MKNHYPYALGLFCGIIAGLLMRLHWSLLIGGVVFSVFYLLWAKQRMERMNQSIPQQESDIPETTLDAPLPLPENGKRYGIENHFEYCLWDTGVMEITSYIGTRSHIDIPDTIAGHPVIWLGSKVFYKCRSLLEVTIPDGVSAIGSRTFADCTELRLVRIPDSVESILDCSFRDCPNLTIEANTGSYAEKYCIENNISFRPIG